MTLYQKLTDLLPRAGLSEAETRVYVELLKNPAQTSWELVERTGIAKSVVYRACAQLESLQMIERGSDSIRARSLKGLVADLATTERNARKIALKLRDIDPLLKVPADYIERFDMLYTPEQVAEAYIFISEQRLQASLDIGDLENMLGLIGGLDIAKKFQRNRSLQGAKNDALLTTDGPCTQYFCTKEAYEKYQNTVHFIDHVEPGTFTGFTDNTDHVFFARFNDQEVSGVLVKSRAIADTQRRLFDALSRERGSA